MHYDEKKDRVRELVTPLSKFFLTKLNNEFDCFNVKANFEFIGETLRIVFDGSSFLYEDGSLENGVKFVNKSMKMLGGRAFKGKGVPNTIIASIKISKVLKQEDTIKTFMKSFKAVDKYKL
jgi:hypothetical protein